MPIEFLSLEVLLGCSFANFLPEPEPLVLLGGQISGFQYLLNFYGCFVFFNEINDLERFSRELVK